MPGTKAKKRLGQHFLVDKNIAYRIVNSIGPQPGDNVAEIGPGRGVLTNILLENECHVSAIEFDRDMIAFLESKFGDRYNFRIIEKDFLKISSAELPENIKIIGNIPYNITTAILEKLFEFKKAISKAVFTIQSEVADRLTAAPGIRAYGSFTVIMTAGFDIRALFNISPKAFRPVPAVASTVIKLTPVDREPEDFENFKAFIRGCFKQKRKTLSNSMQLGLNLPKQDCENLIEKIGKVNNIRPEQLSFNDYVDLYNLWCDLKY
jgi:16S rRNA (adenine1518-N6/adenine1519-N6)-dimethyltransferase